VLHAIKDFTARLLKKITDHKDSRFNDDHFLSERIRTALKLKATATSVIGILCLMTTQRASSRRSMRLEP
jgi:hypothetical protein